MKKGVRKKVLVIVISIILIILILLGIYAVITGQSIKDIFSPPKQNTAVTQCNDHLDNDGNGYCDFKTRGASCASGVRVGSNSSFLTILFPSLTKLPTIRPSKKI